MRKRLSDDDKRFARHIQQMLGLHSYFHRRRSLLWEEAVTNMVDLLGFITYEDGPDYLALAAKKIEIYRQLNSEDRAAKAMARRRKLRLVKSDV